MTAFMVQECNEYTIGFCTKDAFKIDNYTKNCTLLHSKASKEKFELSYILMGFENEVYETYKQMIYECDNKVKIYNDLINNSITKEEESIEDLYMKCVAAFKNRCTDRSFLKLMKDLQSHKMTLTKDIKICEVCSAFYRAKKEGACGHFMHESYEQLRSAFDALKVKIEKLTRKNE